MTRKTTPLTRLMALGSIGTVVALAACSGTDGVGAGGDEPSGADSGSHHTGSKNDGSASTGDDDGSAPTGDDDGSAPAPGDDATTGGGTDSGLDARAHGDARAPADAASDGNAPTGDSSTPPADESAWLDPQNAARAALNVGEQPLVWNEAAAKTALAYAQKCTWAHNPNRNAEYAANGGGSGGVGENIAAGTPSQTIAAAVGLWVGEKAIYDYATNTCHPTTKITECGHYTQIVWATTTSVGCAKVTCTTNWPFTSAPPAHYTWDYSVCDYAPPGNYVGKKPY